MQSKLFSNFDPEKPANEQFFIDFDYLAQLTRDQKVVCVRFLEPYFNEQVSEKEKELLISLASELDVDEKVVLGALGVISHIFKNLSRDERCFNDTPENILDDLIELLLINETERDDLQPAIVELVELSKEFGRNHFKEKKAEIGILPAITGLNSTIDLRAVLESSFKMGGDSSEYKPKIVSLIPIATLGIYDNKNEDGYFFQATKKEIQLIIENLKSTIKDLDEASKHIEKSES